MLSVKTPSLNAAPVEPTHLSDLWQIAPFQNSIYPKTYLRFRMGVIQQSFYALSVALIHMTLKKTAVWYAKNRWKPSVVIAAVPYQQQNLMEVGFAATALRFTLRTTSSMGLNPKYEESNTRNPMPESQNTKYKQTWRDEYLSAKRGRTQNIKI